MYYMYMIVSSITQNGFSPLHVARQEGHNEVVSTLLDSGADPNLATKVRMGTIQSLTTICVLVHCPIPLNWRSR